MNTQNTLPKARHDVSILGRKHIDISGVREVISFDDSSVSMLTDGGDMVVDGAELKIGVLDTERGVVSIDGRINGITYYESGGEERKRFFGRIFKS